MHIKKLGRDDWQAYKALRLEALARHGNVFGGEFDAEFAYADDVWQDMFTNNAMALFGLYDSDKLIGITGVARDRDDPGGKTAVLFASYIRDQYRGQKLSHLLYQARIDWAKNSGLFDRITVGHRDGNEASRRANQAFGFEYTHQVEKTWGDGSHGIIHHYEMRLK